MNPHQHEQPQQQRPQQSQFENFTASSLYCEKCRATTPVRERLLLVLPDKEIFDYLCTECGSSVGQREVPAGENQRPKSNRRDPRTRPARRRRYGLRTDFASGGSRDPKECVFKSARIVAAPVAW